MALSVPVVVALSVPVCRQETQGKISPSSLADAQDNHGLYLACLLVNNKLSTDRGKGNGERYQRIKINIHNMMKYDQLVDDYLVCGGRFESALPQNHHLEVIKRYLRMLSMSACQCFS